MLSGPETNELESGEEEEIVCEGLKDVTNPHDPAEMMSSLPPEVRKRVRALRNVQKQFMEAEGQFYKEVHALECKYRQIYGPLYDKRAEIVNGVYEPTPEECVNSWREESDDEADLAVSVEAVGISGDKKNADEKPQTNPPVKGIPDFWYTIFKNVAMLSEMMQPHDEPIIKCLTDIKVFIYEEPCSFTLEFHFAPNKYFTNTVLTKNYSLKYEPDEESPLEYEGIEICFCKGCEINWNKGMNVTVKTIKKKQKHKSRGSVRIVTKSVQADSFFNFFSPPALPEDRNTPFHSDVQALLNADFEIGHYFRERVVPRAVLLYTGEGLEDEDDDDDDYEEEEEEDCSSDESEDEIPSPQRRGKKAIKPNQQNPAECKQQ